MNELVSCSTAFMSAGVSVVRALEQQRHRAAHHRRRHARARQLHVGVRPVPDTCRSGYVADRYEPAASADTMWLPGAATSGFITRSYRVGPFELYAASVSSDRCAVSCVSIAPTVSAYGLLPGDVIPPYTDPAVRRLPVIARRRHHDDAGAHRALHRLAQRIVAVRLQHRRAERQVDDPDVVFRAGARSPSRSPRSRLLAVPDPSSPSTRRLSEIRARRDAAIVARVGRPARLPGDDRRHVRAVAEPIDAVAAGEVLASRSTRPLSALCRGVDPRIDHRHRDAAARSAPARSSRPAHT